MTQSGPGAECTSACSASLQSTFAYASSGSGFVEGALKAAIVNWDSAARLVPSREWLEFEGDVISSLFAQTESALVRRWRSRHENEYHKSYSGIG
jgi:hypothetical protein